MRKRWCVGRWGRGRRVDGVLEGEGLLRGLVMVRR